LPQAEEGYSLPRAQRAAWCVDPETRKAASVSRAAFTETVENHPILHDRTLRERCDVGIAPLGIAIAIPN